MTCMLSLRHVAGAAALLAVLCRAGSAQDTAIVKPWRFQVDLGLDAVGGNRDLTVANTTFIAERRPNDRLITSLKLEARYGRSNGVEAVNYQLARARLDWNPRRLISPFVGLDIARDPVRKSALRIQGGTGVNFNVNVRDADRTWLSAGAVWDHERFFDTTAARTDLRWMLRAATQRTIGPGTRIEALAKIQPAFRDAADYLAAFEASVRVAISRKLGLTTKVEWKRDSRPSAGVKPDDRALSAALSFAW
jgi:hypothetical protein